MSMKTSLSLGALAVVALLVAGIAYWKHEARRLAACRSVGFGWRTSSCSASQCSASTARSASQCSASTARTASQCSASTARTTGQCSAATACTVLHPTGDHTVQPTRGILPCQAAKPTRDSGARAGNSTSLGDARSPNRDPAR